MILAQIDTPAWLASMFAFFGKFFNEWSKVGNILMIIVVTLVLRWVLLLITRRIVRGIVSGVKGKEDITKTTDLLVSPLSKARVVQRTRTIGSVTSNVITWTLVVIALISVLGELGFNTGALVTSAGILGVAVSFGAQSLVKDFLTGIFMVFEDQLGVGDVVDLGTVSGTVEAVGLRVTSVRAADGTLWYVRNGEILKVGNQSQGWGRAIVQVDLPTDSDFEAVQELMLTASREMIKERYWLRKIEGKPELWGITALAGDTMVVKLAIKTRPSQQDDVARELRLRILRLFNQYDVHTATTSTLRATIESDNPRVKGRTIADPLLTGRGEQEAPVHATTAEIDAATRGVPDTPAERRKAKARLRKHRKAAAQRAEHEQPARPQHPQQHEVHPEARQHPDNDWQPPRREHTSDEKGPERG
ncbi:mechanosensitive ion channel family protein [Pseudoclavibacter sp. CFCC 11306]|uniref:mechanosensitive ion channel family protein n=1 Tax=Pseudoclavibacter sp. CFCC 11306 TaxID=1564493 RepID=UPI001300D31D|nr:mechanosensitive ion channel family protein [Pseudoclavibacter sp. CFCC 11306]KAB1658581.1 mechanosensitive ion channel [Pseudoclavibacter sp. CFCC 11306]